MDHIQTIRRLLAGYLLLLLTTSLLSAQEGNVLERAIRLPQTQASIYELLGLVSERSGLLFIYDSQIIDNEQTVSIREGTYTLRQAIGEITGNEEIALRVIENHILLYLPDTPMPTDSLSIPEDTIQGYFSIEGVVKDRLTNEPIAFGSIGVGEAAIGTITNLNGEFKLRLPDSLRSAHMQFSHIGYQPQDKECAPWANQRVEIALDPKVVSLQEVIVRMVNPLRLLDEMKKAKRENYPQRPTYLTTFYREGIERKKKFISLTEAVFKVYKTPYHAVVPTDQVKLLKMRRIINEEEKDTLILKMRSGINACLLLDLVKDMPEFLAPGTESNYQYAHTDIAVVDNRLANVIRFEQRRGVDEPLYQGEIYIDSENNALLRVDFEINPKYIGKATSMFVEKKSRNLRITPQQVTYTVSYKSWNGIYFINHIRGDLYFKIKKNRQLFNTNILHTWFEMATCQIDTTDVNRFTRNERLPTRTVFSDTHFQYDESFWGNFNVILPEEKLNEAIRKITSKIEETNN